MREIDTLALRWYSNSFPKVENNENIYTISVEILWVPIFHHIELMILKQHEYYTGC